MTEKEATNPNEKRGQPPKQSEGDESLSLAERYERAVALVEASQPKEAIPQLERLQHEVARLALFSSNESLDDISTKSIPMLALEHFLAMAYTSLPSGPGQMSERRRHLLKSVDLWASFLQKLESLGDDQVLSPLERQEYQTMMEYTSADTDGSNSKPQLPPAPKRDDKIARFRAKQQARQEVQRLQSLRERRTRLGISAEEVLDDVDEETLDRNVAMTNLLIHKAEALDEWGQTLRELPMIERMAQMEQEQSHMERHTGTQQQQQHQHGSTSTAESSSDPRQKRQPAPSNGLKVTHINLDAASGQLQFKKEEIKSQVFRPGWNQPTMSLEQFADRERAQAIEREQRQKEAEQRSSQRPRRYDQLLKDGMEDDMEAVDASAAVDRAWDDWKDENPRGSGNKRGELGDRNF